MHTKGDEAMVDGTCAGAAGTPGEAASGKKPAQPTLSDLIALFLPQALSANGELHFGPWLDEPLRLADFIA
jgi:hypothetical protein